MITMGKSVRLFTINGLCCVWVNEPPPFLRELLILMANQHFGDTGMTLIAPVSGHFVTFRSKTHFGDSALLHVSESTIFSIMSSCF